jgi:hypothetical protein
MAFYAESSYLNLAVSIRLQRLADAAMPILMKTDIRRGYNRKTAPK